jgi:uncharacterized protein (DUF2147 family)
MIRTATIALGATLLLCGAVLADPIEGTWKRANGTLIKYASVGGDQYCGTVMTGKYKGQSIGCMNGKDGSYRGKVNKLDEGKTYTGKATVRAATLALSGCVFVLCKTENLTRQ